MTMCARVSSASPRCVERQLQCAGHFAVERDARRSPAARNRELQPPSSFLGGLRQPCSRARARPSAGLSFPRVEHLSYFARQFGRRIRLLQEGHSLGHAFLHDDIFCVTGDE
jgi:hypothetical protein